MYLTRIPYTVGVLTPYVSNGTVSGKDVSLHSDLFLCSYICDVRLRTFTPIPSVSWLRPPWIETYLPNLFSSNPRFTQNFLRLSSLSNVSFVPPVIRKSVDVSRRPNRSKQVVVFRVPYALLYHLQVHSIVTKHKQVQHEWISVMRTKSSGEPEKKGVSSKVQE